MAHTRRAHVLMDPNEYEQLERIALQRRTSVGELIRRAVREQYLQSPEERLAAIDRIAAMEGPTGDWSELERDIEAGYDAGLR